MTLPPAARAWVRRIWVYIALRFVLALVILIALFQGARVTGLLRWE